MEDEIKRLKKEIAKVKALSEKEIKKEIKQRMALAFEDSLPKRNDDFYLSKNKATIYVKREDGTHYMRKSPRKTQEIKDIIMNIYERSTEEERQIYDKYSKLQPSKQLDYISSIYSTNRPSGRKIMKLTKIN